MHDVYCSAGQQGGCRSKPDINSQSTASLVASDIETGKSLGAVPRSKPVFRDQFGFPIGGGGWDRPRTYQENS